VASIQLTHKILEVAINDLIKTSHIHFTSREKLIPGEFGFAGDLHAGGNVLIPGEFTLCAGDKKLALANFLYAPGIKVIPGELETGSPGMKIQKFQKNSKNSKKI
jgi:hypothetical protein